MPVKTEIDVETLLHWAYRDELSKRITSAAEGIWDRVLEIGQHGGIDPGHGGAQRYSHFGLPDPDAERIEIAVSALGDAVVDWRQSFASIAGELAGLVSVNQLDRQEGQRRAPKAGWGAAGDKALQAWWGPKGSDPIRDRPRDVLMVGGIKTAALVTMHAIKGTRPDWIREFPEAKFVPALKGPNAMIVGECRGRNLYTTGSHCPLAWEPSPLSIITSRAEYAAWHNGLCHLAQTVELSKFIVLSPKAPAAPWADGEPIAAPPLRVMPNARNDVGRWGVLPLAPVRERAGPPRRAKKAGEVRMVATSPSA